MHPQNKMPGSDPFYFHFIFIFFILKGAPAPPFYFCTPDGGISVFFLGLWWEPHLKTGFPCLFGLFWKIMPICSISKRDFPFFGLVMGTSGKSCQYLLFENGISVFFSGLVMGTSFENRISLFLGLWWEPLENNANIFYLYLKTGFPLFYLACDGNLWKIMPISSIWKRDFRCLFWLVMATPGK